MADSNPQRLLRNLGGVDARELGLKVLGKEAMIEFMRNQVLMSHAMVMTAAMATSEQFPVIGRAGAKIHTPGQELTGEQMQNAEIEIDLEDFVVYDLFFSDIDKALSSRERRGPYSRAVGSSFRNYMEADIFRTIVQGARSASTIPGAEGHGDGNIETNAAFANDGIAIYQGIFDLITAMEVKDVPTEGLGTFLDPIRYALLVQSEKPIDSEITGTANGGIDTGIVRMVNNVHITKTNNVSGRDDTANTDIHAPRRDDYSNVMGLCYHRDGVGVLKGVDITFEDERQARKIGDLLVARMLYGMGHLRPETLGVLQTS